MSETSNLRRPLSKSLRFEVFKRDRFKCQYCGRGIDETILEVDHVTPVAEGGENDITNLVTSCRDCNRGKGKKLLSDSSVAQVSRKQVEESADHIEQSQMFVQWIKEIRAMQSSQAQEIVSLFKELCGVDLCPKDILILRSLLNRFTFEEVYTAAAIAIDQYADWDNEYMCTTAILKIGGICWNRKNRANMYKDPTYGYVPSKNGGHDK